MKYTILGFNQSLAVEYDLNMNDLLLLQYVMYANNVPDMKHMIEHGVPYVWLQHAKISEDLPILGYTEGTLKNKFSELKKKGFIQSVQIPDMNGSKTYYAITELTVSLLSDTPTSFKNDVRRHAEMTSNNQSNNNKLNNTLSKDNVRSEKSSDDVLGTETEKPKKKNLFSKCSDMIQEYTNDKKLKDVLYQYLELILEKSRVEGKPMYANQFKGMLNKLDELVNSNRGTHYEIVQQSLTKGYVSFFPANSSKPNYQPDTNKAPQHLAGEKAKNKDGSLMTF